MGLAAVGISCSFPALRTVVACFLEAGPMLVSVVGLLFFFTFTFSVAGTELFAGQKADRGDMK